MQFLKSRVTAVGAAALLLVTLGGVGGAVAGDLINSRDIKNDSVRSVDVKNGTLRVADLRPGAVEALAGQDGRDGTDGEDGADSTVPGPQGPKGDTGPQGPAGADGKDGQSHDINATWTANPDSRVDGYTAVLKGTNTSVETTNLGVTVKAGDIISFEYSLLSGATCTAGGPRMFVKVGDAYENTFDNVGCGSNGEVAYALKNGGTITHAGLVHDNGSGGTVYVTDVLVNGLPIFFG